MEGSVEGWKDGRMEVWKRGRVDGRGVEGWVEDRKTGRGMEGWKTGRREEDGREEEGRLEGWMVSLGLIGGCVWYNGDTSLYYTKFGGVLCTVKDKWLGL